MAIPKSKSYKNLPPETIENQVNRKLYYRAFSMDLAFLYSHPGFNWQNHIDRTFYDCLESTKQRFMRVT